MSDNIFNSITTGTQKLISPINGLNKTALDNLAKVAELQFSMAKYLADVGITQLKAAAEINNLESARLFATQSLDVAGQVNKRLLDESQKFFSLGADFKNGVGNLFLQATESAAKQPNESRDEQKAKKATTK